MRVATLNNTKRSSPGEGKWILMFVVIEIEPGQVKGCLHSQRNRCKRIGPVRNRVRALRSLIILFSIKRFVAKGTEPIHVSSTGTECRLKKVRTFRIHIGLQAMKFHSWLLLLNFIVSHLLLIIISIVSIASLSF